MSALLSNGYDSLPPAIYYIQPDGGPEKLLEVPVEKFSAPAAGSFPHPPRPRFAGREDKGKEGLRVKGTWLFHTAQPHATEPYIDVLTSLSASKPAILKQSRLSATRISSRCTTGWRTAIWSISRHRTRAPVSSGLGAARQLEQHCGLLNWKQNNDVKSSDGRRSSPTRCLLDSCRAAPSLAIDHETFGLRRNGLQVSATRPRRIFLRR